MAERGEDLPREAPEARQGPEAGMSPQTSNAPIFGREERRPSPFRPEERKEPEVIPEPDNGEPRRTGGVVTHPQKINPVKRLFRDYPVRVASALAALVNVFMILYVGDELDPESLATVTAALQVIAALIGGLFTDTPKSR